MDLMIEFKDIVWAYDSSNSAIIKYQNGELIDSFLLATNETVIKIMKYKSTLHAITQNKVIAGGNGRILKLSQINIGTYDSWEILYTVAGTVGNDIYPVNADILGDDLVIISYHISGYIKVYSWDGTDLDDRLDLTIFACYSVVSSRDGIYIYGGNLGSSFELGSITNVLGVYTYTQLSSLIHSLNNYPIGFDPIGKKLIAEYNGILYYVVDDVYLRGWNLGSGIESAAMELPANYLCTSIMADKGIVYCAIYNSVTTLSNIMTYVIDTFYKEKDLVSGEGRVLEGMKRISSDPIFQISEPRYDQINCFKEYMTTFVLGGKLNPVIKYGSRLEFFTDTNVVTNLLEKNGKEVIDELCTLMNNYFKIDTHNQAKIFKRDLVGYNDKYLNIAHSTDYGDQIIKSIENMGNYPNNFRRIELVWENPKYGEANPIVLGSISGNFASLDISSVFLNHPISAENIGMYLFKNMGQSESLDIILSLLYFLEGDENLGFDIGEGVFQIDKEREWKILDTEHDLASMTTTLKLIERVIADERYDI
jgi:hypothetical protein